MKRAVLIGIAGGSGSGKTTVARALASSFRPEQVQIVPLDAYYKDRSPLPRSERERINYDHPDAFDEPLLLEHLSELRAGRSVEQPVYDYVEHARSARTEPVPAVPVVIVEGILVLALAEIRPLLDLKLFVDTDADLRFLRRMRRDVAERGRTVESVMEQYVSTVRPMHEEHVQPSRRHADLILPGEGEFDTALGVLEAWGATVAARLERDAG